MRTRICRIWEMTRYNQELTRICPIDITKSIVYTIEK